jgi:pilus assembly protein CpaB
MLLGLVAALCAAILVGAMKGSTPQVIIKPAAVVTDNGEVKVLVASRPLSAMTAIVTGDVAVKTMPRDKAPVGFTTQPVDVIGKVLSGPLAEGGVFTDTMFSGQIGTKVSAVIPPGKRAVGISVADYAGLDGLLYPGAMVDVVMSLRSDTSGPENGRHDALATTLLENVQVLAVETQSVVSPVKPDDHNDQSHGSHRVTLLVDSRQAKALELAMQQGALALAMRNPMDDAPSERDSLSEGSMVSSAPVRLGAANSLNQLEDAFIKMTNHKAQVTPAIAPLAGPTTEPTEAPAGQLWETTIMHGDHVETKTFVMPVANGQETAGGNFESQKQ